MNEELFSHVCHLDTGIRPPTPSGRITGATQLRSTKPLATFRTDQSMDAFLCDAGVTSKLLASLAESSLSARSPSDSPVAVLVWFMLCRSSDSATLAIVLCALARGDVERRLAHDNARATSRLCAACAAVARSLSWILISSLSTDESDYHLQKNRQVDIPRLRVFVVFVCSLFYASVYCLNCLSIRLLLYTIWPLQWHNRPVVHRRFFF
jgi:hypothetical protein